MPFTPFHMGPALLIKPVLNHRFSLIVFGTAQVLMDIEPGIGMLRDSAVLHGPSHALLGALLVALVAAAIGRLLAPFLLRRFNRELTHYRQEHLKVPIAISWPVAFGSALFGTFSHLLLDALMHMDMAPLAPLSDRNPLLFAVPVMHVYGLTVLLGSIGVAGWMIRAIITRPAASKSESAPS